MTKPLLIIGNKNYSSWSLRPWLAMKVAGLEFDEQLIPLFEGDWAERKAELPSGTVPVLVHDGNVIWETLAILEYIAETWPKAQLWPRDKAARAWARAVSSEMHAGFTKIRGAMPMNIRSFYPGRGLHPGGADEVVRIETLWTLCLENFAAEGDFLFGNFSIADAMFAPIVSRFTTYDVPVSDRCRTYMNAVQNLPAMKQWSDAARAETWTINSDEVDVIKGKV